MVGHHSGPVPPIEADDQPTTTRTATRPPDRRKLQ
jgi:hypothetical protein